MIAGLVVLYAFRILEGQFEKCVSVNLRQKSIHSKTVMSAETSLVPPNPKCYVCSDKPFVNVFVNTNKMTVKEFETEILKKSLNMIAPDAFVDVTGSMIISSEEGETEVQISLKKSLFCVLMCDFRQTITKNCRKWGLWMGSC